MRWPASRPPLRSRQSSPTNLSTDCWTCGLVPQRLCLECMSNDPAVEVLMVFTPCRRLVSIAVAAAMVAAVRCAVMTSITPKPSLRSRGMSCIIETWRRSRAPSSERPLRLGPWRLHAWPLWLSARVWRTSNIHSTSALDDRSPNQVDDTDSCFRLNLRYTALRSRIL